MSNDQLYERALEAITRLFSDQSVGVSTAIENLESLQGEIDIMIDSLKRQDPESEEPEPEDYDETE